MWTSFRGAGHHQPGDFEPIVFQEITWGEVYSTLSMGEGESEIRSKVARKYVDRIFGPSEVLLDTVVTVAPMATAAFGSYWVGGVIALLGKTLGKQMLQSVKESCRLKTADKIAGYVEEIRKPRSKP